MATRVLTVALRAAVQGYTAPMAKAAAATGPLEASLMRVQRTGMAMSNVGRSMTRNVTLPILAIGAAAVKMAIDFDDSMSKIVGLVGISRDEVDGMREDVLKLSGETAKAPTELADALFTVTSAGLRGGAAMDVLEAAAKASAAGMGETRAIAEAVTASINTYGSETLTAAEATDIFVATARAGNFATEELTGAMGRVLPFAQSAGASLEDVGGAVALLTRSNNDANESITQMAGLFRAFVRPSQTAIELLGEVGLTAEDLRTSMGEQGLVATLQMLDQALGGNRETLGRIIEDSTGFSAAIQILDADAESISSTFGGVADSAGITDEAFEAAEESAGFAARQGLAKLQVALIQIGDIILPIAAQIVGFASGVVDAFSKLPGGVQQAVIWFGLLLAATGPLLRVGGALVTTFGRLTAALVNFSVPAGTVAGQFNSTATSAGRAGASFGSLARTLGPGVGIAGAATIAAIAFGKLQDKQAANEAETQRWSEALQQANGDLREAAELMLTSDDQFSDLRSAIRDAGIETSVFADALSDSRDDLFDLVVSADGASTSYEELAEGGNQAAAALLEARDAGALSETEMFSLGRELSVAAARAEEGEEVFLDLAHAEDTLGTSADGAAGELDGVGVSSDGAGVAMGELGTDVDELGGEFEEATSAIQEYVDGLQASIDPLFAAIDATDGLTDAQNALDTANEEVMLATADLEEAQASYGDGSDEVSEAQARLETALDDVEGAERGLIDANFDNEFALLRLADAVDSGEVSLSDAKATIDSFRDAGNLTASQARTWKRRLDDTTVAAEGLAVERDIPFTHNMAEAKSGADALAQAIINIPSSKTVAVSLSFPASGSEQLAQAILGRQHGGPISAGRAYVVGESGPELFVSGEAGRIVPNHQLGGGRAPTAAASMAGGGGLGGVSLHVSASDRLTRAVMDALRYQVRVDGGGNVQRALGQGAR